MFRNSSLEEEKSFCRMLAENRMVFFGLVSIWIFLRHAYLFADYSFGIFDFVVQVGDVGVDIFMFLSAYGLSISWNKNRNMSYFYGRRIMRILPSTVFLLIIFALLDTCMYGKPINQCVNPRYWIMSLYSTYWFIGAILVFYLFFPIMYYLLDEFKHMDKWLVISAFSISIILIAIIRGTGISLLQQLKLNVARIPILTIGILCAARGFWNNKIVILLFVLSLPLVYLLPKDYQRVSYSLMTVGLILALSHFVGKMPFLIKKCFAVVGRCSLEFYLIHFYILYFVETVYIERYVSFSGLTLLAFLLIAILMSILTNTLVEKLKATIVHKF